MPTASQVGKLPRNIRRACEQNKKRCLALSSGRASYHADAYDQAKQDIVFSCQGFGLHQIRQSWLRTGIGPGIPTGSHYRPLAFRTRMHICGNERREELYSTPEKTSRSFWRNNARKRGS